MRTKTIINGKGEPQASRIEIPIEGNGGALGMQAVKNLIALIDGLKEKETIEDVITSWYIICGYGACRRDCGFMTEKSLDDLMHVVEQLVDNEAKRVAQE